MPDVLCELQQIISRYTLATTFLLRHPVSMKNPSFWRIFRFVKIYIVARLLFHTASMWQYWGILPIGPIRTTQGTRSDWTVQAGYGIQSAGWPHGYNIDSAHLHWVGSHTHPVRSRAKRIRSIQMPFVLPTGRPGEAHNRHQQGVSNSSYGRHLSDVAMCEPGADWERIYRSRSGTVSCHMECTKFYLDASTEHARGNGGCEFCLDNTKMWEY